MEKCNSQSETSLSDKTNRIFSDTLTIHDITLARMGLQLRWTTALDGRVVEDLPLWSAYTGQSLDEMLGLGWLNALHPHERTEVTQQWLQAIITRTAFEAEFRVKGSNDQYRCFLAHGVPIIAENDIIQMWVGICIDITQQRQREEQLRHDEWNYRATFEQTVIGIMHIGLDGRLLRVNNRLCTMLGYSSDELLQRTFREINHPEDLLTEDDAYITQAIAGLREPYIREKRYIRKDGSHIWVHLTVTPVSNANNTILYFVSSVEDISERKQVEEEIASLEEQEAAEFERLEQLNTQLGTLQAITDSTLTTMSPDELLQSILQRIREIMHIDNIAVLLLSDNEQYLTIIASQGLEESSVDKIRIPIGEGFAGRVASEQRAMIVRDTSQIEVMNPILHDQIHSLLGTPLVLNDRVIGVLHIGTAQTHDFTEDDLQLLGRVANRIVLAIERVKLYEAEQRAQEESVKRLRLLETIFETINDGIVIYDASGNIVQTNTAAYKMLRLDAQPKNYNTLPVEERSSRLAVRDEFGQAIPAENNPMHLILRKGVSITSNNATDLMISIMDRDDFYINVTGGPMRNAEGEITGAVCVFHDVTKRRQLERRTEMLGTLIAMAETLVQSPNQRDRAAHLHTLFMHMVGQRIVELTQKMLRCQRVAMVTIESENMIVQPIAITGDISRQAYSYFQLMANFPLANFLTDATLIDRLAAKEILTIDLKTALTQEGISVKMWDTVLAAPIHLGNHFIGLLYTAFDNPNHVYTEVERELIGAMTKLSALAIERERHEIEHEQLMVVLQETNTQLEMVNKLQNDFISVVSHEFRTTLTSIQGFSELLRDEDFGTAEVKEYASDINADARRLTRMITELLDLERMKMGNIELNRAPINFNAIVREVTAHIGVVASRHTFNLDLAPNLALIDGDYENLTRIVTNLLSNAVKYSPSGGEILLATYQEKDVIHFTVHDTGIGIPETAFEQIFIQYNRVESNISRYIRGTGLGLPIVRQIVQLHGGKVWVESKPGQGSTFHVTLPMLRKPGNVR